MRCSRPLRDSAMCWSRSSRRAATLVLALIAASCSGRQVPKEELVRTGDEYLAQQKYREAIIQYRNAIAQDGRYGIARAKLARAYAMVSNREGALREYVRAAD